jgi:hypothetical protein
MENLREEGDMNDEQFSNNEIQRGDVSLSVPKRDKDGQEEKCNLSGMEGQ